MACGGGGCMGVTEGHVLLLAGPQLVCLPWAGPFRLQRRAIMCTEGGSKLTWVGVPVLPLTSYIILECLLTSLKLNFSICRAQLIQLATSECYVEDSGSSNVESMFRALYIVSTSHIIAGITITFRI